MKKFTFLSLGISAVLAPALALAQQFGYVNNFITQGRSWLITAVTVMMVLMTLWFLWAVFKFIGAKEPADIATRRKQMINGMIGLFVAVGVWGIIKIAQNFFGIQGNDPAPYVTCPPGYFYNTTVGSCVR